MTGSMLVSGAYYGETTRRVDAGRLTFVQTRYAPRQRVEPHSHERPYFCFLTAGAFDERAGTRRRRYAPGSLIYHPAGETHSNRFEDSGGMCLNVEAPHDLLAGAGMCEAPSTAGGHFAGGAVTRLARDICREVRTATPSALVLEGLGLALIGEASRAESREPRQPPPWLPRALDLMHDRFREPIGLSSMALELGLHPVHLARAFRRHTGATVGERIRALRIAFACAELSAGARTIAEIAHASGFADQAHFTRVFRALVGTSPARYRARRRDH
jgi:AraC family transcriptional regulator